MKTRHAPRVALNTTPIHPSILNIHPILLGIFTRHHKLRKKRGEGENVKGEERTAKREAGLADIIRGVRLNVYGGV
jgi:hypothetical protein